MITSAEQWSRFDRLAWTDTSAAARQEQRLAPSDRARADARLALRRDAPNALALLAALPAKEQADPAMRMLRCVPEGGAAPRAGRRARRWCRRRP